jgi:hypothetical protein
MVQPLIKRDAPALTAILADASDATVVRLQRRIEQLALQLAAQPVERAVAKLALAVQLVRSLAKARAGVPVATIPR